MNLKAKIRGWRRARERSSVRTDEFTVPLRQVGWGWGHGKTRWVRGRSAAAVRAEPSEETPA